MTAIIILTLALSCAWFMNRAWRAESDLEQMRAAVKVQKEHYDEVSRKLQSSVAQQRAVQDQRIRTVEKIVMRPVYRNVCLDGDGMRVANDALGNARSGTDGALPAPDGTGRRDGKIGPAKDR